jgi:methionine biosynthesis protein MetW
MDTDRNHSIIEQWIRPGARVLDLGCGDGRLLKRLADEKNAYTVGVEISEEKIIECLKNGICVYQADIDEGISNFEDMSFEYVILNETLQVIYKPHRVIEEMLRVGLNAIISVSNFGYIANRLHMLSSGRISSGIRFDGSWHDSPVIRFFTVSEFEKLLSEMGIVIEDARYFMPFNRVAVKKPPAPDLLVKGGLFSLRRA